MLVLLKASLEFREKKDSLQLVNKYFKFRKYVKFLEFEEAKINKKE